MGDSERKSGRSSYSTSPFVRLLEAPGRVKMLDIFLRKHYESLSASQVAELADINPSTFHRNIGVLLELDIVRKEDEMGQKAFYQLNKDNELTGILEEARRELVEQSRPIISATEEPNLLSEKEIIQKIQESPSTPRPSGASDKIPSGFYEG